MRLITYSVVLVGLGQVLFANAPDSLAGRLYYESGRTLARSSHHYALSLQSDGTFRQLFGAGTTLNDAAFANSGVTDGQWQYRRLDDTTGELTLMAAGNSSLNRTRTLRFTSDDQGFVAPESLPAGTLNALFRVATASSRAPLLNCSNRSFVRPGAAAYTGFVISGPLSRAVLVRAVGPALGQFGITDALADPKLVLRVGERSVAENDDWESWVATRGGESIQRTGAFVGAFPLTSGSKDAAVVVYLAPGAYVVEASSRNSEDSGQVLVEVYILP